MVSKSFTGGQALEKRLSEMAEGLSKAAGLRVGFLENASLEPGGLTTATVAAIQEFGAPRAGIPPRPFFRTMIADKSGGWGDQLGANLKASNYDAEKALDMMGEGIAGQLQDSITAMNEPELSPVTLMLKEMRRKGGANFKVNATVVMEARARIARGEIPDVTATEAKPLVDTGHLRDSVGYDVTT